MKIQHKPRRQPVAPQPQVTENADANRLYMMSALVSRAMMAQRFGMQFNGDRDLYTVFGYLQNPDFNHYLGLYERQGMATSIVEAFPSETWRKSPVLLDGTVRSDNPQTLTAFLKDWNAIEKQLGVFRAMRNIDILAGIGRFGVLFLGVTGENFSQPVLRNASVNLAYLSWYDEGRAEVYQLDKDKTSPRYGLPLTYKIQIGESGLKEVVHYTRVIHVAENKIRSRIYGRPRLQTAINRLFDVEKVVGGSSEAVWLSVYKGFAFIANEKDGYDFPDEGSTEAQAMKDAIDEYVHGLRRYMRLKNVTVQDLGTDVPDPSGIYDVLVSEIAGTERIPKRILIGSEAGELASTQDDENWASVIQDRQRNYAEPEILRPFIDWCIEHGVLSKPTSGEYGVEWQSLFHLNDLQKADLALKVAQALEAATGGVPETVMAPEVFAERYLDYVSENPTDDAEQEPGDDESEADQEAE
jgi:hypothetical protein